jgi:hypothetical protein
VSDQVALRGREAVGSPISSSGGDEVPLLERHIVIIVIIVMTSLIIGFCHFSPQPSFILRQHQFRVEQDERVGDFRLSHFERPWSQWLTEKEAE